jgi:hypothetical protein
MKMWLTEKLRCSNEVLVVALGRYLDKAKCKWFNEGKYM